ncbi:MAG TPA: hypothetical protein VHI99_20305 [Vicinamibacterales bacterium]|nr:hypothetical protein [Vicinamibacterales bacterium]
MRTGPNLEQGEEVGAVGLLQHIEANDPGCGQAERSQIIEHSASGFGVRWLELAIDDELLVGLSPRWSGEAGERDDK